jgi:hypothetical protein
MSTLGADRRERPLVSDERWSLGNEPPPGVPHAVPLSAEEISPEDLAKLLTAGMMPTPGSAPGDLPGKGSLRRKLLVAVLIAAVGVGASFMSCVGQSFSYRQARALEGIEHEIKEIRAELRRRSTNPPAVQAEAR